MSGHSTTRYLAATCLLLLAGSVTHAADGPVGDASAPATKTNAGEHPNQSPPKDQATLDKWFTDLLTNATMVGGYTVGDDKAPKEDRYTIVKAVKGAGDNWVITAKIEYKGFGVPVNITVAVRWAGDTPVIQLTDQKVPALGTFTARVMFYGTHYAGTWDAGTHGGLMWGRIEHTAGDAATKPAAVNGGSGAAVK